MNRKHAIITGASRGIGKAIAEKFAAAGYDLTITCHDNTAMLKDLSDRLEKEQATLVDPGSEYGPGGERCIRLNLATQERNIDEFVLRLSEVLRS